MEDKLQKMPFSIDEISQLEALDIKGGQAIFALQASQQGCPNNATGCACTIVVKPQR